MPLNLKNKRDKNIWLQQQQLKMRKKKQPEVHQMALTIAPLNLAAELFGAAYFDAELAPTGVIANRSGFDKTNAGNTFFEKFQGSTNTNNLVIRFTDSDVDVPIQLDGASVINVTLIPIDRSTDVIWRDGIFDYYASNVHPDFGVWLQGNVGNTGDFRISWRPS